MQMAQSRFAYTKSDNHNSWLSPSASCCGTLIPVDVFALVIGAMWDPLANAELRGVYLNINIKQPATHEREYCEGFHDNSRLVELPILLMTHVRRGCLPTCETNGIHVTVFIDRYAAIRWHAYLKSVPAQACIDKGACNICKALTT